MDKLEIKGGARIAIANASYPFATLLVNKDCLELKVSILADLKFKTSEVLSIEPHRSFPFRTKGVKINHTNPNINKKVIFWTFTASAKIISQIKEIGFLNH